MLNASILMRPINAAVGRMNNHTGLTSSPASLRIGKINGNKLTGGWAILQRPVVLCSQITANNQADQKQDNSLAISHKSPKKFIGYIKRIIYILNTCMQYFPLL